MPVISMFYGIVVMMYYFDDRRHHAIAGEQVFKIEPLR